MNSLKNVAIVHDWLVSMRGGEKVLEVFCELFPHATVFTLVYRKGNLSPVIEKMNIKPSFLQSMPGGVSHYQYYLPLFPTAIRGINVRDFDLILSSSSAAAKGVQGRKDASHICYCHTPMRYIWDQYEEYFGKENANFPKRLFMGLFLDYLRRWDKRTAEHVTSFIANSRNVQERIKRIYNRESKVIYPPVDVNGFSLSTSNQGYYLIVSALVPYKRVDVAIDAFNKLNARLLIIGDGMEINRLKKNAKQNIEFLGRVERQSELNEYYGNCKALIFPGEEDFGIVPVEAMSCGKPVIAYKAGGALETVVEGTTGMFFGAGNNREQRVENLAEAVRKFERMEFNPLAIRSHAMNFEKGIFKKNVESTIANLIRS